VHHPSIYCSDLQGGAYRILTEKLSCSTDGMCSVEKVVPTREYRPRIGSDTRCQTREPDSQSSEIQLIEVICSPPTGSDNKCQTHDCPAPLAFRHSTRMAVLLWHLFRLETERPFQNSACRKSNSILSERLREQFHNKFVQAACAVRIKHPVGDGLAINRSRARRL